MLQNYITLKKLLLSNPLMGTIKLSRYKFVSKMLDKNDVIIDVGCGGGYSTLYYSKFCKSVIGIDIDKRRRKEWNEFKDSKIKFFLQDATKLQNMNFEANCIVNVDFIEHIEKKKGVEFIKNCKIYLENQINEKNKMFIIGTPSFYSRRYRAKHNLKHHKYEYKPEELNEICKKFFPRTFLFTMNDEIVHTGFNKLGWFFFVVCVL